MALSNIFHEPRREITETAIGLGLLGGLFCGLYGWTCLTWGPADAKVVSFWGAMGVWTLVAVAGSVGLTVLCVFVHWVGEEIADVLEDHGIQLRPKHRY